MKKILSTCMLLLTAFTMNAQKDIKLNIINRLGNSSFAYDKEATNDLSNNFKLSRVEYYISGITLIHDGGMTTTVPDKYILVNGSANLLGEALGTFNIDSIEGIKFHIGVDTPVNNADPSLQPAGSSLAFQTPSMHWGWSAGYRFVALEGTTGNGFTTTFELHGLWNANYFEQTVMLPGVNTGNEIAINLDADYTQALKGIDISSGPIAHGINVQDLQMLENFRDYVFAASTGPVNIKILSQQNNIRIFPNPSNGIINIDTEIATIKPSSYTVTDISGKTIQRGLLQQKTINLSNHSGVYIITLFDQNNTALFTQNIVVQ